MKKFLIIFFFFLTLNIFGQEWQIVGDMPYPVYGGEAVVKDSLIYIIGGFSDSLGTNVNFIQEYNPLEDSWRITDTTEALRYGFVADNYGDSILMLGGIMLGDLLDSSLVIWNLVSTPYVYDFSLNFIRSFPTGLIYNDIFYVFGGVSLNPFSTYMFEYNIPTSDIGFSNNFNFLGNLYPSQQMSAISGNFIYLFGGIFIGTSRAIYRYDIQNRTLDLLNTDLIKSRAGGRAVNLNDTVIYIMGGYNEINLALSNTEILNLDNDDYSITEGPELNYDRSEFMAVNYNNSIYVFGGKNDLGFPVEQVEKLDFATTVVGEDNPLISDFHLYPNYPNPFNPSTSISFYLPSESSVNLTVFNSNGEEIFEMIKDVMNEGTHQVLFSTSEKKITPLSSGVYFYRLTAFNFSKQKTYIETRKMLLLK